MTGIRVLLPDKLDFGSLPAMPSDGGLETGYSASDTGPGVVGFRVRVTIVTGRRKFTASHLPPGESLPSR